ncbi:MAG: hypothetical protein K5899_10100 [Bacteroidaceae bacterium]|jgi:hypothetical protein|nr:hypothetical protein [Bacteroidaceae bacterium]
MKKLVFAFVAMMIATCSFAQAPQGGFGGGMGQFNPEDMAKRQADQLKTTCELNDEQYKKVKDYYVEQSKAQMEQMQKMMQGGQGGGQQMDMEAMRKQMQERQEAQNKFLKGVLTEDQFKKYETAQAERRRQFQGMGGQGGPQGQRPQGQRPQGGQGGFGGGFPGGQRQQ